MATKVKRGSKQEGFDDFLNMTVDNLPDRENAAAGRARFKVTSQKFDEEEKRVLLGTRIVRYLKGGDGVDVENVQAPLWTFPCKPGEWGRTAIKETCKDAGVDGDLTMKEALKSLVGTTWDGDIVVSPSKTDASRSYANWRNVSFAK